MVIDMIYNVIKARTTEALVIEVNELIEGDWVPQGGLSCCVISGESGPELWFFQAMAYVVMA